MAVEEGGFVGKDDGGGRARHLAKSQEGTPPPLRLIGVPPAGSLRLLLVSWCWSGPPQMEARRNLHCNSIYDGILIISVLAEA